MSVLADAGTLHDYATAWRHGAFANDAATGRSVGAVTITPVAMAPVVVTPSEAWTNAGADRANLHADAAGASARIKLRRCRH